MAVTRQLQLSHELWHLETCLQLQLGQEYAHQLCSFDPGLTFVSSFMKHLATALVLAEGSGCHLV